MRQTKILKLASLFLVTVNLLFWSLPVAAASSSSSSNSSSSAATISSAVPQSYNADSSVLTGMIVKLKDKDPSSVEPVTSSQIQAMLGVVVPANNVSIVLTPKTVTKQQVLVATSGTYSMLVSNQNGSIHTGDFVTISAIAGIGMKADDTQLEVVGKAAGNFDGTSNVIGTTTLKDQSGQSAQVSVGRIQVDLQITHNPLFQKNADYVPGFLAKAAQSVAGRPVSVARIYLSMVLLFVTGLITGILLFSGVRSGMIAVGRNPLSKKSILRSLVQTVIAGLIIFVVGIFAVYLLLKF